MKKRLNIIDGIKSSVREKEGKVMKMTHRLAVLVSVIIPVFIFVGPSWQGECHGQDMELCWQTAKIISGGQGGYSSPSIACHPEGDAIVTFAYLPEGEFEDNLLMAACYEKANGWLPPETISHEDEGDARNPASITYDPNGNAMVLFSQSDRQDGFEPGMAFWPLHVYVNWYTADGGGWTGPGLLDQGNINCFSPRGAFDPEGNAMVVFNDISVRDWNGNIAEPGPENDRIMTRRYQSAPDQWGNLVALDADNLDCIWPAVDMAADGNAIAVYKAGVFEEPGTLYSHRFDARIGRWSDQENISGPDLGPVYPSQLRVTPEGRAHVLFRAKFPDEVRGQGHLYANHYRPDLGWGEPVPIGSEEHNQVLGFRLAMNERGDAAAVFVELGEGNYTLLVTKFNARDNLWEQPRVVDSVVADPEDGFIVDGDFDLVVDPDGNVIVVYKRPHQGVRSVFARRYFPETGRFTRLKKISADTGFSVTFTPLHVVCDGAGDAIVTFTQPDEEDNTRVYAVHSYSKNIPRPDLEITAVRIISSWWGRKRALVTIRNSPVGSRPDPDDTRRYFYLGMTTIGQGPDGENVLLRGEKPGWDYASAIYGRAFNDLVRQGFAVVALPVKDYAAAGVTGLLFQIDTELGNNALNTGYVAESNELNNRVFLPLGHRKKAAR